LDLWLNLRGEDSMARPFDQLDAFVFAKLPAKALDHLQDLELPDLPEIPDAGNLPVVEFTPSAFDALSDLPEQAHLPDWLI
jgi:hypothetical protein